MFDATTAEFTAALIAFDKSEKTFSCNVFNPLFMPNIIPAILCICDNIGAIFTASISPPGSIDKVAEIPATLWVIPLKSFMAF